MTDKKEVQRQAIRRHAWWLLGAAVAIYGTYIVYVYVYTLNN